MDNRGPPDTYEFPVCLQVLLGGAKDDLAPYVHGYLNMFGVDVLPEHNRWQCDPGGQIAKREHLLRTRTISQALRKRLVLGQNIMVTELGMNSTHPLEIKGEIKEMPVWLGGAAAFPSFCHDDRHLEGR